MFDRSPSVFFIESNVVRTLLVSINSGPIPATIKPTIKRMSCSGAGMSPNFDARSPMTFKRGIKRFISCIAIAISASPIGANASVAFCFNSSNFSLNVCAASAAFAVAPVLFAIDAVN